jgi:hypothetical protein
MCYPARFKGILSIHEVLLITSASSNISLYSISSYSKIHPLDGQGLAVHLDGLVNNCCKGIHIACTVFTDDPVFVVACILYMFGA